MSTFIYTEPRRRIPSPSVDIATLIHLQTDLCQHLPGDGQNRSAIRAAEYFCLAREMIAFSSALHAARDHVQTAPCPVSTADPRVLLVEGPPGLLPKGGTADVLPSQELWSGS